MFEYIPAKILVFKYFLCIFLHNYFIAQYRSGRDLGNIYLAFFTICTTFYLLIQLNEGIFIKLAIVIEYISVAFPLHLINLHNKLRSIIFLWEKIAKVHYPISPHYFPVLVQSWSVRTFTIVSMISHCRSNQEFHAQSSKMTVGLSAWAALVLTS